MKNLIPLKTGLFVLMVLIGSVSPVFAEDSADIENTIPFKVPKVGGDIKVDAVLDEAVWQQAVKVSANIEVRPGENIEAPVKTEALIAYNDTHIFVGFNAFDPNPEQIRARYCDRDNIWDDDWILILFDTFNDQRRTYDFGCNPLGIQTDFIENTTGSEGDWDAIWESDGRITDEGYIVEMAIPFSSLNFPGSQNEQIWGFDIVRSYPRSVRHHIGAFPRDRNNNCYMCQALKLKGFEGVSPGKNIEIDPTFSAVVTNERDGEDALSGNYKVSDEKYAPGVTAHWGITPNITFSGTLNPDFSNVEADVLQLDINNQFAVYYPEKRPFFLESGDFFNTPLNAVHTRSLADPDWGVKLSGREGRHTIGFFTAQDKVTNFLIPGSEGYDTDRKNSRSFGSAFRYKMDINNRSNIGLIATDREADNYFNRTGGIDGDFKFSKKDRLMFQVMGSQTEYPDSIAANYNQPKSALSGKAMEALYIHDTRNYEFYALYHQIDKDFRADMGFMSQAGYKFYETGAEYRWLREAHHWFNRFELHSEIDYMADHQDNLLKRMWSTTLNYQGPMDSHSHFTVHTGRERYNNSEFQILDFDACYGFRPVSDFYFHIYTAYGDRIDYSNTRLGTRFCLYPSMDLNIGLHLKTSFNYTFEKLNVDAGRVYTANISDVRMTYQFNKRMFVRGVLQYVDYDRNTKLYNDDVNSLQRNIFSQFLFSYKINPHTVFFLGYSDNSYQNQDVDLIRKNFTVFTKIGYAIVP